MDVLQAVSLGAVQGITEWLPISSKAMVALAGKFLFGMPYDQALSTAVFLHIGTLVAAIAYLRKDVTQVLTSLVQRKADRSLLFFIVAATFMTGIVATPLLFFALNNELPEFLFTSMIGVFLLATAWLQKGRKDSGLRPKLTVRKGLVAGFFQGLAGIPGMSRSGTTISALIWQKVGIRDAMRLSFLMSIPAVLGAELALPLLQEGFSPGLPELAGAAVAGLIGFFTIDFLLKLAARVNFWKVCALLGTSAIVLGAATLI